MSNKIQKLLTTWPAGCVRLVSYIKKEGYSQSLLNGYRASGWLTSIGDNAVYRTGDTITIHGGLYALQQELKTSIHIGGISALELSGFAHYLRGDASPVRLYGTETRLPKWFTEYKWSRSFVYKSTKLFSEDYNENLKQYSSAGVTNLISSEVRAIAEYLSDVPGQASIEEAKELMAGLTTLHPNKVNSMLKNCNSIKVKRLFLILAELCNQSWIKKIRIEDLDLGSGTRNLTPGGVMNKKYLVSLPASLSAKEQA